MLRPLALALPAAAFALSGCLARTALDVVTAPVKLAGKAADLATTSQSESDEKRGRALRQREEQLGRIERRLRAHMRDCRDGDESACDRAEADRETIEDLISGEY